MKRSTLQLRVSKFIPKKFYEIDRRLGEQLTFLGTGPGLSL